ncbi:MAG: TRAP transporter small permease subunit [Hyphomonas sp.]|uniref:TRAP transporter small permease subunit n=1 Tax=Hyphomonas sp. TaxID=87 RepID=UPI0017E13470|nr:TRAP transporter small permease subunit [Hyphomonas sp.]MBU3922560.1 TRAP transporter small permease subunit [Alphaproteobacteria bacterium]MBA3067125.1 TRAP transporter small permease subunit [Hyphomonas sp.]MBU4063079.1 TRAP transporter small permease subunit [Alphaproteobacteria bacterium]MBU4164396.1 TRAP transporter small permease subunit [Alphaproteobacteria bacterium]MBU4569550.1 TRAP transporter small permease subunit [Alphaproteobacteria bacterium]
MDPNIFLTLGTGLKWVGLALLPLFALPLIALALPGLLDGAAKRLSALIDRLSGAALGAAMVSGLILLFAQLSVVVLRYAFGLSFTWLSEVVMYAFAAMFMLGAAGALRDGAHVRVDILRPRFGEAGRHWIELAGAYLFLFPICMRIITTSEAGLTRSWMLLEGSRESDGLPILFLFKTLVPALAVLLMAQGLSESLKAALRLTGALPPEPPEQLNVEGGGHGA